jgi:ABC-type arginine transport system permease subunit
MALAAGLDSVCTKSFRGAVQCSEAGRNAAAIAVGFLKANAFRSHRRIATDSI